MKEILNIVAPTIPETLYMVIVSTIIAVLVGTPLGIFLYTSQSRGLAEKRGLYRVLDTIINIIRSLPFVVLMLLLFPVTRFIVGKRIGTTASIVPLAFSAIPFMARLVESNLNEIPSGIIEAAQSMGASTSRIIRKVLLKEALPQLVQSITLMMINLIGLSAIVGMIGGGGLGDIAIRYGYQRNETGVLWVSCIVIILLVQIVQISGNKLAKKINKKN